MANRKTKEMLLTPTPSARRFYRTVFEVEVLSEEPLPPHLDLDGIADVIREGSSGMVRRAGQQVLDGPAMAKALLNQGSEPGFFRLTMAGEDEED